MVGIEVDGPGSKVKPGATVRLRDGRDRETRLWFTCVSGAVGRSVPAEVSNRSISWIA